MKVVHVTTDPSEASLFVALLGQEGVKSKIENEGGAYYAVGLPTAAVPLKITVGEADVERATKIIQAILTKRSRCDQTEFSGGEEGSLAQSVESGRRRWIWMFILGYTLPTGVILVAVAATGWEDAMHSPTWRLGGVLIFLLLGIGLWSEKRRIKSKVDQTRR